MRKCFAIFLVFLLCVSMCGCLASAPGDSQLVAGNGTTSTTEPFRPTDESSVPDTESTATEPTTTDAPVTESTELPTDSTQSATEPPHQHRWNDATCTSAATCTECGETQGDPKGHQWQAATCTHAKTCTVCGATEGKNGNHSWKDATCTDPKTCTECGKTQGKATGHDYADGVCIYCGAEAPSGEVMVWIPTNGGTKYHSHSGCSNMKDPKQVPQSEAEALGFTPCKRCH